MNDVLHWADASHPGVLGERAHEGSWTVEIGGRVPETWRSLHEARALPWRELVTSLPEEDWLEIGDPARALLERSFGRCPRAVSAEDMPRSLEPHRARIVKLLSDMADERARVWGVKAHRPRSWAYVQGDGVTEEISDIALPDYLSIRDVEAVLEMLGTPVGRDPGRDYDAPYWTELWDPSDPEDQENVEDFLSLLPETPRERLLRELEEAWCE